MKSKTTDDWLQRSFFLLMVCRSKPKEAMHMIQRDIERRPGYPRTFGTPHEPVYAFSWAEEINLIFRLHYNNKKNHKSFQWPQKLRVRWKWRRRQTRRAKSTCELCHRCRSTMSCMMWHEMKRTRNTIKSLMTSPRRFHNSASTVHRTDYHGCYTQMKSTFYRHPVISYDLPVASRNLAHT